MSLTATADTHGCRSRRSAPTLPLKGPWVVDQVSNLPTTDSCGSRRKRKRAQGNPQQAAWLCHMTVLQAAGRWLDRCQHYKIKFQLRRRSQTFVSKSAASTA